MCQTDLGTIGEKSKYILIRLIADSLFGTENLFRDIYGIRELIVNSLLEFRRSASAVPNAR